MAKVAVILVNYKDYVNRFLDECRDSLRGQTYSKDNFRVYIVDNASSEESRSFIKQHYSEAIIVQRNDGNYSAANNAGIEKAKQDGADLFVIANMDTKFTENWLHELIEAVNSDEKIGIAQSLILLYPSNQKEEEEPLINSAGNVMHYLGFGFTDGYGEPKSKVLSQKSKVEELKGYASGCSLVVKKEVLDKIGGYDEEYYMYHDDIELNWRAKLAGYKIVLAPKSVVYHKYEFARSVRMLFYMERNRYLVLFSFYKFRTILLILPALLFMELAMLLYSVAKGWFKTKLRVYGYFLKLRTWRHIIQVRKQVRGFRIKKDKQLIRDYAGKILFQEIENPLLKYIGNPILNLYLKLIKKIIVW